MHTLTDTVTGRTVRAFQPWDDVIVVGGNRIRERAVVGGMYFSPGDVPRRLLPYGAEFTDSDLLCAPGRPGVHVVFPTVRDDNMVGHDFSRISECLDWGRVYHLSEVMPVIDPGLPGNQTIVTSFPLEDPEWSYPDDPYRFRERFLSLAHLWRHRVADSAFIREDWEPWCRLGILQRIVSMGKRAAPLIFEELDKNPYQWFHPLWMILGAMPNIPDHVRSRFWEVRRIWLQWGSVLGIYNQGNLSLE